MEETEDVNRDALVANVGTHIPATEASFEEEAQFEVEEEEAPRATFPQGIYMGDLDEWGEVVETNPMDTSDIRDAPLKTLEHRFRESLRSYQRFISNHYRIDETIVLTNAYLKKGDGIRQTEMVEKKVLDFEDLFFNHFSLSYAITFPEVCIRKYYGLVDTIVVTNEPLVRP